jgi:hypothetical protein
MFERLNFEANADLQSSLSCSGEGDNIVNIPILEEETE